MITQYLIEMYGEANSRLNTLFFSAVYWSFLFSNDRRVRITEESAIYTEPVEKERAHILSAFILHRFDREWISPVILPPELGKVKSQCDSDTVNPANSRSKDIQA